MEILVTGGAGYIGSVAVKQLLDLGHEVIVVDNLSKGKQELVDSRAKFYHLDLTDKYDLESVFSENNIQSVIHFAGYKAVGESMRNPQKYSDNITGTINLLNLMVKYNVQKIIYSSTASVYKEPENGIVTEESPTAPESYYGYTKLACEELIKWYSKIKGINYIILRYFNVGGDGGLNYLDPEPENVLPKIMEVLIGKMEIFEVYGNDYNTLDGTGVRDYIDVSDLVEAHILSLKAEGNHIINLGTNNGTSVKELIETTEKVSGKMLPHKYSPRRPGDIGTLVTSNEKARTILNWNPTKTIEEMITSIYKVYTSN